MIDAATVFERSIAALRLGLTIKGCDECFIERAVADMREERDRTREWLRKVEQGASRRNPFPGLRVYPVRKAFRRALRAA